jgi:hypothetical protein
MGAAGGGAGAGSGTAAGTGSSASDASVASLRSAGTEFFSLVIGLILVRGVAIAAIGVIKIANDSKQATNTLALPGINSGFDCFTVVIPKTGRTEEYKFVFENIGAGATKTPRFVSIGHKTNTVQKLDQCKKACLAVQDSR